MRAQRRHASKINLRVGPCRAHKDAALTNRHLLWLALALVASPLAPAVAQAQPMLIRTTDLNGAAVTIPTGLQAPRTLILIGFHHGDQEQLDAWRAGLRLTDSDSWIELPVISGVPAMVHPMIRNGLRRRLPTAAARAHVAPAFINGDTVAHTFGVPTDEVSALVIDSSGTVIARHSGPYDGVGGERMLRALR